MAMRWADDLRRQIADLHDQYRSWGYRADQARRSRDEHGYSAAHRKSVEAFNRMRQLERELETDLRGGGSALGP